MALQNYNQLVYINDQLFGCVKTIAEDSTQSVNEKIHKGLRNNINKTYDQISEKENKYTITGIVTDGHENIEILKVAQQNRTTVKVDITQDGANINSFNAFVENYNKDDSSGILEFTTQLVQSGEDLIIPTTLIMQFFPDIIAEQDNSVTLEVFDNSDNIINPIRITLNESGYSQTYPVDTLARVTDTFIGSNYQPNDVKKLVYKNNNIDILSRFNKIDLTLMEQIKHFELQGIYTQNTLSDNFAFKNFGDATIPPFANGSITVKGFRDSLSLAIFLDDIINYTNNTYDYNQNTLIDIGLFPTPWYSENNVATKIGFINNDRQIIIKSTGYEWSWEYYIGSTLTNGNDQDTPENRVIDTNLQGFAMECAKINIDLVQTQFININDFILNVQGVDIKEGQNITIDTVFGYKFEIDEPNNKFIITVIAYTTTGNYTHQLRFLEDENTRNFGEITLNLNEQ